MSIIWLDTRKNPQYRPIEIIHLYMRHDQVSTHPIVYIDVSTSHSHYSHPTTMFNQSDENSLHHMASLASIPASQWSIDSSSFDQTSMPTCPPFAHFLPWYQPTSTCHSYHMGDPFVHGYSHMGYTFEGLTGRMSTNEIGERMHEAWFCGVQALPQEDDILSRSFSAGDAPQTMSQHGERCWGGWQGFSPSVLPRFTSRVYALGRLALREGWFQGSFGVSPFGSLIVLLPLSVSALAY